MRSVICRTRLIPPGTTAVKLASGSAIFPEQLEAAWIGRFFQQRGNRTFSVRYQQETTKETYA
jgi:hypothetical protein